MGTAMHLLLMFLAFAPVAAAQPPEWPRFEVPIREGGICVHPLWLALHEGETVSGIQHIDAREYRIRSQDGRTVTVVSSANGVAASLFRSGEYVDLQADNRGKWQVHRRSNHPEYRYVYFGRHPRVREPVARHVSIAGEGLTDDWIGRAVMGELVNIRCG
jgi:1,2-phenylacetyl-CoA epoxidase PaaB subunit